MENHDLTPEQFAVAANGLSAIAITLFEMGEPDEVVRAKVYGHWQVLRAPSSVFAAAASTVTTSPQPLEETAEKSARLEQSRGMLGAAQPQDQLVAMLKARELLEALAIEHGSE